jgi:hypothetical protein
MKRSRPVEKDVGEGSSLLPVPPPPPLSAAPPPPTTSGDANGANPNKKSRTIAKRRNKSSELQLGRVCLINYGDDEGKLCTVIDVVDSGRALVDGPTKITGVTRQIVLRKRLSTEKIGFNSFRKFELYGAHHTGTTTENNSFIKSKRFG